MLTTLWLYYDHLDPRRDIQPTDAKTIQHVVWLNNIWEMGFLCTGQRDRARTCVEFETNTTNYAMNFLSCALLPSKGFLFLYGSEPTCPTILAFSFLVFLVLVLSPWYCIPLSCPCLITVVLHSTFLSLSCHRGIAFHFLVLVLSPWYCIPLSCPCLVTVVLHSTFLSLSCHRGIAFHFLVLVLSP